MTQIVMLPDPARFAMVRIEVDEARKTITIQARTTAAEASSPLCQQSSSNVHSTYICTLADLPCLGQHVRWQVQVRRFFCRNDNCPRKIFTDKP